MSPPDVVIRPARPEDAARLYQLHTASVRTLCSSHYHADIIEGWLANRTPSAYLGAIERGALFVPSGAVALSVLARRREER